MRKQIDKASKISASFEQARRDLRKHADPVKARVLQGFFKTGKGEYAEGDVFIGVVVPRNREVAKKHQALPMSDLQLLIRSSIHEERLLALFVLSIQYQKGNEQIKERCFQFYLKNLRYVNNWDLVDGSAPLLLGTHLMNHQKDQIPTLLNRLVQSPRLWERRIAMISTFAWLREGEFSYSLDLAERLLKDSEDLIHKAVGWVLREIGKRDLKPLLKFLDQHSRVMPRTMLRYAIERFPEPLRLKYLKKG